MVTVSSASSASTAEAMLTVCALCQLSVSKVSTPGVKVMSLSAGVARGVTVASAAGGLFKNTS